MPDKAHTQQAVKITYRHNTNGVAFTRTVQIIGHHSTNAGGGLQAHACAHIHTNNKFTCTGELKIPTLPTPSPKVHPSLIKTLTLNSVTKPSPMQLIFRDHRLFMQLTARVITAITPRRFPSKPFNSH
jgi:hypothetical protein